MFKMDATAIAQQIREGQLSVSDAVEHALANIEAVNDQLNAVVHVQADAARALAADYDEQLKNSEDSQSLPAFFGVPILMKDLGQNEGGQPSTSGSRLFKGFVPEADSHFTEQIRAAGFVIVGRTNTPEFGFKNETDATLHGYARNPNDLSRSPGGSSGGATAALKAGVVPIVAASDGGGSIRIPASLSGVIGLKPTRGRTPVGPGSYRGWQGASIDFVNTISVRDTWEALKALQVTQKDAPFMALPITEDELVDLDRPLKIAYNYDTPIGAPLRDDARLALDFTINLLQDMGHQVEEVDIPIDGRRAMESYYIVNGVETQAMMQGIESNLGRELTPDDMEPMSWALYRSGLKIDAATYSNVLTYWDQMAAIMEAFFEDYDMVLSPTTNGPAYKVDKFVKDEAMVDRLTHIDELDKDAQQDLIWEMFDGSLARTPFTQQQNLTGQPAISLPLYETEEGLPIGSQFWAARGQEYLLLQLAKAFEERKLLKTQIIELD